MPGPNGWAGMKGSNSVRKAIISMIAVLAAMAGSALPLAMQATPASAAVSCTGTSVFLDNNGFVNIPTVGNNTGNDNCELGLGNDSGAVGTLQSALNRCHGAGLVVDNDYGPKTMAAVENAQRAARITVDGIYGPQTRDHITWPHFSKPNNQGSFTGCHLL